MTGRAWDRAAAEKASQPVPDGTWDSDGYYRVIIRDCLAELDALREERATKDPGEGHWVEFDTHYAAVANLTKRAQDAEAQLSAATQRAEAAEAIGLAHLPIVFKLVRYGLEGDVDKVRAYGELLHSKLGVSARDRLGRILAGDHGSTVHLAGVDEDD